MKIKLAYSPCPNDCFMFYGIKSKEITINGVDFEISLHDIETLNQKAKKEEFDITKLSFPAFFNLQEKYEILNSGTAIGRDCGPIIVAGKEANIQDLKKSEILVPGELTTAALLLNLYLGKEVKQKSVSFENIIPLVKKRENDFGVIIHEGRFTYKKAGLKKVVDLGSWWEEKTNLPIPLGLIAIKKNIDKKRKKNIENALKESIEFAFKNRDKTKNYIKQNAQELDDKVIEEHINLYVNDFSIDLGNEGRKAIDSLLRKYIKLKTLK